MSDRLSQTGSQGSGSVGRFAVPRRRFLVRKRPGQRQTTKRAYSAVLLAPPEPVRSPSIPSNRRSSNASPRPAILGRSPARSSSLNAGAVPSPAMPSPAMPSPAMPSPAVPSPAVPSPALGLTPGVQPSPVDQTPVLTTPVDIPTPATADATPRSAAVVPAAASIPSPIRRTDLHLAPQPSQNKNKNTGKRWQPPAKKKRVRGSSSEAKLVLRQVEAIVAERRSNEDDLDLHESCKKFVQELASELSDQAQIIDENSHLLRAHRQLGEQKRALKAQLLEVQQQRGQLAAELSTASGELKDAQELQTVTTDLSEYLYRLEKVQHQAIKKTAEKKETPDFEFGSAYNLQVLATRATRNINHLAVLQNTNSQLEALLEKIPHWAG